MSKRALAESAEAQQPARTNMQGDAPIEHDEGMGEFEDPFEDEFESDEGEVVDAADEDTQMEIDGVPVSDKIQRLDEEDDEPQAPAETYIPGVQKLEDGQTLVPDQSVYDMFHRMNVTWPCLSFDFLHDHLGTQRKTFPHTSFLVTGTQADTAKNNEVIVMKASAMHRTSRDDEPSDNEDNEDDDNVDDDAVLEYRSIPHLGGVNRIRAAPVAAPNASELCLDPYPVASWSETGNVSIFDVRPLFNVLSEPGTQIDRKTVNVPLYTVENHRGVEGFAMDWGGLFGSGASGKGHLRLLTGDVHSKIFLTTSTNTGFTTHANPFESHTSSIEDLQWSPSEPTVFASCSADQSIRIWDVRVKSHRSSLAIDSAHDQDVNVISWNHGTQYLLLSGGDDGALKVWDMRNFKSGNKPSPVAQFNWHQGPIYSVEWNPNEDSTFAAAGRDDQVTLWDLAVEHDPDEDTSQLPKGPNGEPVPSQLLFCHHGASEVKEVHWHAQIPGMLGSTSADGFHFLKTISV
ncbi:Ribosome assembly protein rrb1 [Malassezia vespertilionis]|uniref:Glutamate-rich WD repeat-containing protein 1 n=1 Tax=Malassezia vespertilionis TaxID=2020962 RepID=A0A2N1JHD1_9BASI|nr:Ribosome assembly protein rrb1 [Malassezia vespertilionis]PKI85954.1 Rrb1p [Malassezia vespertilionis]WFD05113.1 Ribosome assembly protein rrb1 [Malassezia vespertilionis]